jgi:hypothetical protein
LLGGSGAASRRDGLPEADKHSSSVHFTCLMPAPTKAGLASFSSSSSGGDEVGGRNGSQLDKIL